MKLLKDLTKLTDFDHTDSLKEYYSMMLKYCSKGEHFSHQNISKVVSSSVTPLVGDRHTENEVSYPSTQVYWLNTQSQTCLRIISLVQIDVKGNVYMLLVRTAR